MIFSAFKVFVSRILAIPILIVLVLFLSEYRNKINLNEFKIYKRKCLEIIKIGFPIGLQLFIEVTAFCLAAILISRISKQDFGAHNVAIQYAGLTFLLATGFGSAATVLA